MSEKEFRRLQKKYCHPQSRYWTRPLINLFLFFWSNSTRGELSFLNTTCIGLIIQKGAIGTISLGHPQLNCLRISASSDADAHKHDLMHEFRLKIYFFRTFSRY